MALGTEMPYSVSLILSLSKDAPMIMQCDCDCGRRDDGI